MDTVKELVRAKSFWVFVVVALLGGIGAIYPLPFLGVIIAALTILGVSVQGAETVRAQKELDQKHASVLNEIAQARTEAATQHTKAIQEIAQARGEAANQHAKALQEIAQARTEAATQYAEAEKEIKKARDEARAENLLLKAEKFATSLMEKDELVNEAVALCPDFKQRELRQLGIEMSIAVIDNSDRIKRDYMNTAGYSRVRYFVMKLGQDERTFFTDHAIRYLRETVLDGANTDAQGLLYLACMYGYRQQYDEMIRVLDKASQISQIVQVMKAEYRERQMILILLGACGSDPTKIERLRETLNLPRTTEMSFCEYVDEFPLITHQLPAPYIEWVAVRKLEAPGESSRCIIKITPPYPSNQRKVDAFIVGSNGMPETIVPVGKKVSIEELYSILSSLFILFCPVE